MYRAQIFFSRRLLVGVWMFGWWGVGCSHKTAAPDAGPASDTSSAAGQKNKPSPPPNPWAEFPFEELGRHPGGALYVAFSADGKWIASAGKDKMVRVFNASTGREAKTLPGHGADVKSAVFSPDSRQLVSASFDKTARVFDLASGKCLKVLEEAKPKKKLSDEEKEALASLPAPELNHAIFSPDGKAVVTAGEDFALKFYELERGGELKRFSDPGCRQRSLVARRDGPGWVSASGCSADGVTYLRFWDEDGNIVQTLGNAQQDAHFFSYNHSGDMLATADGSLWVTLYSGQGSLLKKLMVGVHHFGLGFSLDDSLLLVGTMDGEVLVFRAPGWERVGKLAIGEPVAIEHLAVAPDGVVGLALRDGRVLRSRAPVRPPAKP